MPKTFDPSIEIPDLSGKVIVLTGGNVGLGAEVIRRLAPKKPTKIIICARDPSKAQAIINEMSGFTVIQCVRLDLSSLESVKSATAEIIASTDRLDLLFLHAGVSHTAPALTKEGYEWQFGVNYLAHALLTQLLMPLLLKTAGQPGADVRVITTASEAAKTFGPKTGLVLDECKSDMTSLGGPGRYGQSMLAKILFARKLAQVYPSLTSISIHPGLVKTENFSKGDGAGWFKPVWRLLLLIGGETVEEGAKTQLWAATAKDAKTGKLYMPIGKEDNGGKFGNDEGKIKELWDWTSKELTAHGAGGWPGL